MGEQFGKRKLIKDISANTLQTLITQLFGLIIFYITSKYLLKADFGEFNWSMAVGSTLIAVSSLGLDLVFVRRIARGENVLVISGIHFFHTLIVGFTLSAVALIVKQFVPSFTNSHPIFFFVFLNLALANMANSFKLCLNGLEAYRHLALLALVANVFKLSLIVLLYVISHFTILNVILAYTATTLLEFVTGYFLLNKNLATTLKPIIKIVEYKYFILESLPQLGVVLFDSALARIDWILLGVLSTAIATAEYSFVYKIFELSKLPLLIIAPVLLTRFSKLSSALQTIEEKHKEEISFFFKLEMFIIMVIPIVLVSAWTPLIDYFTDNKYGSVNELNYRILAMCVPLHCIINFLWTIGFVQGQLKTIFLITISVSLFNIIANMLLIPLYGATGSSVAFLACTFLQFILYLRYIKQGLFKVNLVSALFSISSALIAVFTAKILINNVIFAAILALGFHVCITLLTKQISLKQLKQIILKR